ncbi:M24 family metallopeptidase [Streptosporangium lutulentum]
MRALRRLGPACRVGLVGPVPARVRDAVGGWASAVVTLDEHYTRLRMVKSDEELRWLEHAAALTDLGAAALLDAAGQGRASGRWSPPRSTPTARRGHAPHLLRHDDVDERARPLRPGPVAGRARNAARVRRGVRAQCGLGTGPPRPTAAHRGGRRRAPALYRRLHAVAETVRDEVMGRLRAGVPPAELLASLRHVRAEGLSTVDDLLHGLGGGYLPPVLSGRDLTPRGLHAEPLRAGTTLVVQPNVCTPDLSAGVQTGEMVVVTDTGCRSLHRFPPGLLTLPFDASRPYG